MKLQVSTQIAIFAVLELAARQERNLSVAEIGDKYAVSSHHLAKVMHVLTRAGLVRSARGTGGGYQFVANAHRATLLDVVQLFEDLGSTDGSVMATDPTPEQRALNLVMHEIDDIARATLGSITISTMLKLANDDARGQTAAEAPAKARKSRRT